MTAPSSVSYLVDTNLLLRRAQPQYPLYSVATACLDRLLDRGDRLCVTPQILMEYWNVVTRPVSFNGLGLRPAQADRDLTELERIIASLPEGPNVYHQWRELVRMHGVSGRQVHDAHLVASMIEAGVSRLLSFNDKDFQRYTEVTVLHPSAILTAGT